MTYNTPPPYEADKMFLVPRGAGETMSGHDAVNEQDDGNQDRIVVQEATGTYAVFDGIGGYAGSAVAAEIGAQQTAQQGFVGIPVRSKTEACAALQTLFSEIDTTIQEYAQVEQLTAIGTTAVVLQFFNTPERKTNAAYAICGDSRLYRFRDETLTCLTIDHSTSRNPEDQRALANAQSKAELTVWQQLLFNYRHEISMALGEREDPNLLVDIDIVDVQPGDRFLLTCDGIHDNLRELEMERLLQVLTHDTPTVVANALVVAGATRSRDNPPHFRSKIDDMSAVVVDAQLA